MILDRLNAFRKRVPFWWWLVYDVLIVFCLVALFTGRWQVPVGIMLALALAFSLTIDAVEFLVKRRTV